MDDVFQLPELWVPVAAAFIPLLSALAVKADGASAVRALIAIAATGVLAVVNVLVDDTPDTWESLLATFLTAAVTMLASYEAVWQHLGINHRVLADKGLTAGGNGG